MKPEWEMRQTRTAVQPGSRGGTIWPATLMGETLTGRSHTSAGADVLEQEPGPSFGLVDPDLDDAGGGDVVVLLANAVSGPHGLRELLVVRAQFRQHVLGRDELLVVVAEPLVPADVADGVECGAADLAGALGDLVGHVEVLRRL